MDLFEHALRERLRREAPLAARMRPRTLDEFAGQDEAVGPGSMLRGAVERLARLSDKRLSLTDCASFELMDQLGLTSAFTFDSDFRDCGYTMVP